MTASADTRLSTLISAANMLLVYDVEITVIYFIFKTVFVNPYSNVCAMQWRAAKQQSDGERPKVAVIKSGDANIDNHCAPSTLTGDVADAIDAYRQQQLRVYTEACQLCRESGVVLSERLLRSGETLIIGFIPLFVIG